MEFDWSSFRSDSLESTEVEEIFEDPFSLRFLPDATRFSRQARFLLLGKSLKGRSIFCVYTSTGKIFRVISARAMTTEENYLYERKLSETLS